jgi:hypothetical protein
MRKNIMRTLRYSIVATFVLLASATASAMH